VSVKNIKLTTFYIVHYDLRMTIVQDRMLVLSGSEWTRLHCSVTVIQKVPDPVQFLVVRNALDHNPVAIEVLSYLVDIIHNGKLVQIFGVLVCVL
jgi:hypothetical protein